MNAQHAERIICNWICDRRPGQKVPRLVKHAYNWTERKVEARGPNVSAELFNLALLARDEIMQRAEAYKKRAGARKALADYIDNKVVSNVFNRTLIDAANRLRKARLTGTWGLRPNGDVVTIWDDKSELSRLDPDEAREDTMRLAERYGPRLLELYQAGCGIHYFVATVPNVKPGELRSAKQAIFRRWINFCRIQQGKKKALPEILGSLAVMEDPLSEHDDWNVHLNLIVVTRSRFHSGLYEKIRRLWKFNIHMRPIAGDTAEIARAFREILKYSARVVPEKSHDKASRHHSDAPAMIEWPVPRFLEWFAAQPRFRRTRTYGCLYGSKVPKPEPMSLEDVTWHGALFCRHDHFWAQDALIDLTPGHKSTSAEGDNRPTGPP